MKLANRGIGLLITVTTILQLLCHGIEWRHANVTVLKFALLLLQERAIVYEYFFFFCDSQSRDICLGIIYGYKAVLQIIALIFSFSIRKVKVKGLNDAKSIAAAVYVTSIVTAVIIVSFYSLKEYLNLYATLFCVGFFIGTTTILCLIFIPKVL